MATLPQTTEELNATLGRMKANGAPQSALQVVFDGFKKRTMADRNEPDLQAEEIEKTRQTGTPLETGKVTAGKPEAVPTPKAEIDTGIAGGVKGETPRMRIERKRQEGADVGSTLTEEERLKLQPKERGITGSIGDVFPKLFKGAIDLATKGDQGTAQFGTPLEFFEKTEGKTVPEVRKDLIADGFTPEQADQALLVAINEVESALENVPTRGASESLRDLGGRASVEVPLILATGGFGTKKAISAIPKIGGIVPKAAGSIRGAGLSGGLGTIGARAGLGATEGATVTTVLSLLGEGKLPEAKRLLTGMLFGAVGETAFGGIGTAKESLVAKRAATLEKKIQPKLTPKQQQIAKSEGRVTETKTGIFGGKKPDVVKPSIKMDKAQEVVERRIPNAFKKTADQINNEAKTQIGAIANKIKPDMQKVKIGSKTFGSIDDSFKTMGKEIKQLDEFAALPPATGKGLLAKFERLTSNLKTKTAASLDDAWNTRKAWDDSFSSTVKKGGDNLTTLQTLQRETWKKGRNIFNDTITSTKTGLGKEAQNAFDDMSGLFTVRDAIKTQGIDLKGASGLFDKKKWLKYGVEGAAAFGVVKAFEKTTGFDVPVL